VNTDFHCITQIENDCRVVRGCIYKISSRRVGVLGSDIRTGTVPQLGTVTQLVWQCHFNLCIVYCYYYYCYYYYKWWKVARSDRHCNILRFLAKAIVKEYQYWLRINGFEWTAPLTRFAIHCYNAGVGIREGWQERGLKLTPLNLFMNIS